MKETDFERHFLKDNAPLQDAIEAIVDKLPEIGRKWLFQSDEFVCVFSRKFEAIVNRLPKDDSRKPLEIELAYIVRDIEQRHGIIIAQYDRDTRLRSIEFTLEEHDVLEQYRQFSQGVSSVVDISEPELFVLYLEYLYAYVGMSISHAGEYLQACIRFAQVDGWDEVLLDHLDSFFDKIPQNAIDDMLNEHDYLGGDEWDFELHVKGAQEEEPWISRNKAIQRVMEFQNNRAAFHLFLADLFNACIFPRFISLSRDEQIFYINLLNDFRDIVDPEGYVPLYFHNGNWDETLMRDKMREEWRDVH